LAQQYNGEIRPRRLASQRAEYGLNAWRRKSRVRHNQRTHTSVDLVSHLRRLATDGAGKIGTPEHVAGDFPVATIRWKDQNELFVHSSYGVRGGGASSCRPPNSTGTPVSTPRKPKSGSPRCTPSLSNHSSRIEPSWPPVRFFRTERAFFTLPPCSKYRSIMIESAR